MKGTGSGCGKDTPESPGHQHKGVRVPVGGVLESRQQMCLLKISVILSDSSLECGRASSPRKSSAHTERGLCGHVGVPTCAQMGMCVQGSVPAGP